MSWKQVFPALASDYQPDRAKGDVEVLRDDPLHLAPGVSLADGNHLCIGKFSQSVSHSLVDCLTKNFEFVALVLAPRYKFKVARAVVGFVSIFVIVFVTGRAWADERPGYQHVHQHALTFTATPQAGAKILLSDSAQRDSDFAVLNASNAASVADFVVEPFDLSPFHPISISHATYSGKS